MIQGHGDDAYRFDRPLRADFSSNVYRHVDISALKAHIASKLDVIGSYPEPEPYKLEAALAQQLGIAPESVCVTSGATEAIYLIALAFRGCASTILQPTFSEYADACRMHNYDYDYADEAAMLPATLCPTLRGGLFWLCNPNNPDGRVIPKAELTDMITSNPDTVFIVDQSYEFFTKEPLLSPAEAVRFKNLIQLHSKTKRYAMPGLRLGYITAAPSLTAKIRVVRMPWSVNALAIEAGLFLTANPDTAPIDLPALLAEAQRLRTMLNDIPGVSVDDTATHFMLCHLADGSAAELKRWLMDSEGILIRDASNFEGLAAGDFRVAAQSPQENDLLVASIRRYQEERR